MATRKITDGWKQLADHPGLYKAIGRRSVETGHLLGLDPRHLQKSGTLIFGQMLGETLEDEIQLIEFVRRHASDPNFVEMGTQLIPALFCATCNSTGRCGSPVAGRSMATARVSQIRAEEGGSPVISCVRIRSSVRLVTITIQG